MLLKPVAFILVSVMFLLGWLALYLILGPRAATIVSSLAWLISIASIALGKFGRAYALSLGLVPGVLLFGGILEWLRKIMNSHS